jgi:DNA-binding transcriptional MerR regulator
MKTVGEVCKLVNISRRTLRYYNEIGLLPYTTTDDSGYHLYDDNSLTKLWHILFYKEMGFSLKKIKNLIKESKENEHDLLRAQMETLKEKQKQIEKMSTSIEKMIHGNFDSTFLGDFNKAKFEVAYEHYKRDLHDNEEIRKIFHVFFYPLGIIDAVNSKNIAGKAALIMGLDWEKFLLIGQKTYVAFMEASNSKPSGKKAIEAVSYFSDFVNMLVSDPCDNKLFHSIAQNYVTEKEIPNQLKPNLSEFVEKALLHVYC